MQTLIKVNEKVFFNKKEKKKLKLNSECSEDERFIARDIEIEHANDDDSHEQDQPDLEDDEEQAKAIFTPYLR